MNKHYVIAGWIVVLSALGTWLFVTLATPTAAHYISVRDVDTGCVWRLHYSPDARTVRRIDEYRNLAGTPVCGALPE